MKKNLAIHVLTAFVIGAGSSVYATAAFAGPAAGREVKIRDSAESTREIEARVKKARETMKVSENPTVGEIKTAVDSGKVTGDLAAVLSSLIAKNSSFKAGDVNLFDLALKSIHTLDVLRESEKGRVLSDSDKRLAKAALEAKNLIELSAGMDALEISVKTANDPKSQDAIGLESYKQAVQLANDAVIDGKDVDNNSYIVQTYMTAYRNARAGNKNGSMGSHSFEAGRALSKEYDSIKNDPKMASRAKAIKDLLEKFFKCEA